MRESSVDIRRVTNFTTPRATAVTIVPAGLTKMLAEGELLTINQALGGAVTATTESGEMVRLSHADSVEFGLVAPAPPRPANDGEFGLEAVWAAAATVYDPEIPVDIVELGLVYRVEAFEVAGGGFRVEIDMSVTAPFCGMGDIMRQDLETAVSALPGVAAVEVQLVFDPPWDASRLSDVARLELGML